jgi:hypothetical protein
MIVKSTMVFSSVIFSSFAAFAQTGPVTLDCLVSNQQTAQLLARKKISLQVVQMDQIIYTSPAGVSFSVSLTAFGDDKVTPKVDLLLLAAKRGNEVVSESSLMLPLGTNLNAGVRSDSMVEMMTCSVKN